MRRLRWIVAGICIVVLLITFFGFDAVGADCGDAIQSDGSETFECNAPAYVVMGAGLIACVGLVVVAAWAVLDRLIARRSRAGR
jgi:hypothetical protein